MLDEVLADYAGKVRLIFKDFPLPIHARARLAHEAARCAGSFKKYWEYHDRLFQAQPDFSRADLARYAEDLGIPADPFARCLDEGRTRALVEADVAQGRRLGIRGTPTFLVNDVRINGAPPYKMFKQVIDDALRRAEGR